MVNTKKSANTSKNQVPKQRGFSFIIPFYQQTNFTIIKESIDSLTEENKGHTECIIIYPESYKKQVQETFKAFENHIILFSISDSYNVTDMINHAINHASNQRIMILDPLHLEKPFNINLCHTISQKELALEKVHRIHYNTDKKQKNIGDYSLLSYIFPKQVAAYLFDKTSIKGKEYAKEIIYKLKRISINIEDINLNHPQPLKKTKIHIPLLKIPLRNIQLFYFWFFLLPLKERSTKPHKTHSFIKGSSIYRFYFAALAVILFLLMPAMSFNASVSGDERIHYKQAENYYNFYATLGKDTSFMDMKPTFTYGMSFDTFTYAINQWFNIESKFESRHFINSLCGWLAILFTGLLTMLLAGWRAGLLAMIFMFLSPRFLGHSFNNPKDLPFAMAYVFAIYYIIKYLKNYPKQTARTGFWLAVGIGAAISVRIGGLLLIAYFFLFTGLYYLSVIRFKNMFAQNNLNFLYNLGLKVLGVSILGYFLGLLIWPYGITNPIEHPLHSLEVMSHFPTTLRQIFEGKIYWSDKLPWYYIPKYILITSPIAILIGFLSYIIFFKRKFNKYEYLWQICIIFTFVFPIFWIIYNDSNVYGGWRHALFTYPTFVVAGIVGYEKLFSKIKKQYVLWIFYGILFLLALKPLIHIIRNHPYEYVYFNEFVGGIDNAYSNYEMDYYFHSLKPAAKWFINNIIEDNSSKKSSGDKLILHTNHYQAMNYYLRHYEDQVKVKYCRYYERANFNWDYAIFANTYIDPHQQENEIWPPESNIHAIKVNDEAVVCAVLKQKDKSSHKGHKALKNKNYREAIIHLRKAKKNKPHSEAVYVNLCRAYTNLGMYKQSIQTAYECLEFYPDYDQILNVLGSTYMRKGELKNALGTYNRLINVNPKFSSAYYYMGIIYMRRNQPRNALNYLQQCIQTNRGFKPAYKAAAKVLKSLGKNKQAQRYLRVAKSIGK